MVQYILRIIIMTKNIPVKGWVSILFNTIAFCLWCFVGNVANAQLPENPVPRVETGFTETPSLEIAFAKVSGKVGNSTKTAGCLVVWSASNISTPNIYCRYELEKRQKFLRDDDKNNVELRYSENKKAFKQKIKDWFEIKYPNRSLLDRDITLIAEMMSNPVDKLSLFGSQPPKTYSRKLDKELSGNGKNLADYKIFAASVHEELKKLPAEKKSVKATAFAKPVTESVTEIAKGVVEKTIKEKVDMAYLPAITETTFVLVLLGFSIIFVAIAIEIKQLKEQAETEKKLLQTLRSNQDKLQDLEPKLAKLEEPLLAWQKTLDEAVEQQIKPLTTDLDELTKQLTTLQSNQDERFQDLEPKLAKLEPLLAGQKTLDGAVGKQIQQLNKQVEQSTTDLNKANEQLRSEKAQRKKAGENLEDTEEQLEKITRQHQKVEDKLQDTERELNTVSQQYNAEHGEYKKAKKAIEDVQENLDTVSRQYKAEQSKNQQAGKALKDALQRVKTLSENKQVLQTTLSENEKVLQTVSRERYRLITDDTDFSDWINWQRLQPVFAGVFSDCETIINDINKNGAEKDKEILELLYFDSILKHGKILASEQSLSDSELWTYLRGIDKSKWLNNLLRANDFLQTYFPDEPKFTFTLLSERLSSVTGLLRVMFKKHGGKILHPKLLEEVPDYVLPKYRMPGNFHPNLRALVKQKVQERAQKNVSQNVSQFVVDIEMYGFVTAESPNADVRVWVYNPVEWR